MQAIQAFAKARPPGIYKQDYIENLFNSYNERRPETLVCPSTPEWKRVDLNGEARVDDDNVEDDDGIMAALQVGDLVLKGFSRPSVVLTGSTGVLQNL